MENNNYFVPQIEDIRVGYECEVFVKKDYKPTESKWEVMKLTPIICKTAIEGLSSSTNFSEHIRVPYLTKEQIEAEGWTKLERELNGFGKYSYFKKGEKYITFQEKEHLIEIHNDEAYSDHQTWFEGECKDINTFRYICKLLEI